MDKTIPGINQLIKNEADDILYRQELFSMLSGYGVPCITGDIAAKLTPSSKQIILIDF